MKLQNPILPGFNPDPSICKKGDDYYLAVSSFEWFPGIPIYHSKDLKNWVLHTHALTTNTATDLRRLPSAKGIWAPCLSYCEAEDLFYVNYTVVNSMNARFFDVDNFVITASDIAGPWSEPVFTHSAGFDPSMIHDEDGRKYIVSLEWETRDGYHKPGEICCVEYDAKAKQTIGYPKRIWMGGTQRGCIEGPHIYKKNGYYYLICAEGGTGYGHSVTVGRSKDIFGPYESDPCNPILTATPDFSEMDNDDSKKLNRYNPENHLQKAGHGSFVETKDGEVYMVFHCSRPLLPHLRCTLGREACMQKMKWTEDGWLRTDSSTNLAPDEFVASSLSEVKVCDLPETYYFDFENLPIDYYAPRVDPVAFAKIDTDKKQLIIRGQESLSSLNKASLLAHKLTSLQATLETAVTFFPEVYQEYAGACIYYDNMDYVLLRIMIDEKLGACVDLLQVENGERRELTDSRTPIDASKTIYMKIEVVDREVRFSFSYEQETAYRCIGSVETSIFSDEYCQSGEFTGTFLGVFSVDAMYHKKEAVFDFITYKNI
ncbi:MAG: glycoside hydrolase family 43 protein [Lachnospiraceae bacterium]